MKGKMLRNIVISGLIVGVCAVAQTPANAPTFSKDIAPIFYVSCTTCHRPGQVAPFSLITYNDAVQHGRTIVETVKSGYMPPWKPEPGWVDFRDNRRLTDAQIDLFMRWYNAGMPQGDPAATPAAPTFPDGWQLGTPDLILEMAVPFSVPAEGQDIYRNFVLPTGITPDKYVRAIELKPSARPVVHHVLFYSDNTGTARKLVGQDGRPGWMGSWDDSAVSAGWCYDAASGEFGFTSSDAFSSEWRAAAGEDSGRDLFWGQTCPRSDTASSACVLRGSSEYRYSRGRSELLSSRSVHAARERRLDEHQRAVA